ncbi:purine-binding chemotaxis protein CheW [bacterium]|nr:purine-binding chemotaxis protein CheW [bacterium]
MNQVSTVSAIETQESHLGGLYLTFSMSGEEYGIEILKVQGIIQKMEITPIPRLPDFVKGVINLRGKVIPIIDLRLRFGMPESDQGDRTCIIVVDLGNLEMGVIIDKVSEVVNFPALEIEKTPSFGVSLNTDFILGLGKSEKRVTILLDIQKVLTSEEINSLGSLPESHSNDSSLAETMPENTKEENIQEKDGCGG